MPHYISCQVYVDHVKSRMLHLMSQVSLDITHTLILVTYAEYYAGHVISGYRMETMTARMPPELVLHQFQPLDQPFESEAERIAFDAVVRTFMLAVISDLMQRLLSGLPGVFDCDTMECPSLDNKLDWWVVSISAGQQMERIDDYLIRILHKALKPQRIRGIKFNIHLIRLLTVGKVVKDFC